MFRSPSSYERIVVRVPVGAVVVDAASGDTFAVSPRDSKNSVDVPCSANHVTVLRITTDSNITWATWKPIFHGLSLLNVYNIVASVVDQASGASGTPELINKYTILKRDVDDSVIKELDAKFASDAGISGPSSVFDRARRRWVLVAAGRIGGMGPTTEAVLFGNSFQATIGVRPLHFFEVSYDYAGMSYVGIGDMKDASIVVHSIGLMVREPNTGLFVRGTFGSGRVNGVINKYDLKTRYNVAGTVPCWSWGFGHNGDWLTYEFRQIIIPSGQTINGNSASGTLNGFTFGMNVFF